VRIERVEVRQLALPMSQGFETSFGRTTVKEFLLVAVSADGLTGYGECVADPHPYYLPETNGTVQHVLRDFLIPQVLSADLADPRGVAALLSPVRGHEMAKAALEMAVWDLEARRQDVPLHALLGGRPGRIAAGVSIGLQASPEALADVVAREAAAGYQRIKIKIKPGHDRALVEAVRRRFPELPLMVDANNAYTLADAPLFAALDTIGTANKQGEYYLPDLVAIYRKQKRAVATWTVERADEIRGINSRTELAEVSTMVRQQKNEELMPRA